MIGDLHLVLYGFGAAGVYLLILLAHPVHKCPRCHGQRIRTTLLRHRIVPCSWCRGEGRVVRRGSATVHRLLWEQIGPWLRVRLHDVADRMREDHQ